MTQKNKIFSITLLLLILGSVACRKSGGGGITQTDPIKSLTGNLLIVSTDGKTNLNSLPLSFVGASATVTEVTENPKKLNLGTNNFIIADGALKLTNIDLSSLTDAAVSNKVTLTFSLSGENLSRYTDTADIFVGKYSNIYTNTFDTFTNLTEIQGDDLKITASDKHKFISFKFNEGAKTFFKDNTFNITNSNTTEGDDANELNVKDIENLLKDRLQKNTIFTTYFNDVKVSFVSIDETSQFIATFKVDLTSKSALFETPYTSYNFIFNALKGKWVQ
ncbi:hypothetical protein EPJ69_10050 [Brachyspira aalborgi]|uniref:Lipoprotein n=1 Tax=Brachyspira aalborgi TaxID=29522 RepID=A0A5C8E0S5_9SPIR|nr:hypothetical protein [Brachyspira aalborgi]TXJ30401.1 hypothetical protein EPJ69_10050 [Brachyspira aalborgi]